MSDSDKLTIAKRGLDDVSKATQKFSKRQQPFAAPNMNIHHAAQIILENQASLAYALRVLLERTENKDG